MPRHQLDWESALSEAGLRVTRQRQIVFEAVLAGEGHTSIGEIHARAKRQYPAIRLSTIYRALHVFSDLGVVLTVPSRDGELMYEVRHTSPHHHLVCRQCGTQIPLSPEIAADMVREVQKEHRFVVELDHLVLWGICDACTRANESSGQR